MTSAVTQRLLRQHQPNSAAAANNNITPHLSNKQRDNNCSILQSRNFLDKISKKCGSAETPGFLKPPILTPASQNLGQISKSTSEKSRDSSKSNVKQRRHCITHSIGPEYENFPKEREKKCTHKNVNENTVVEELYADRRSLLLLQFIIDTKKFNLLLSGNRALLTPPLRKRRSRVKKCTTDRSDRVTIRRTVQRLDMAASQQHFDRDKDLFEKETSSDIELLVGVGAGVERIPAHSWVLTRNNDHFRKLLAQPAKQLHFPDDPKSFRNFIGWLYGCYFTPSSTKKALDTLHVAMKYSAVDLIEHLVSYLITNLRVSNVLCIMAWIHQSSRIFSSCTLDSPRGMDSELAPSAPPAEDSHDDELPPPYAACQNSTSDVSPPPYKDIYDNACIDPTMACTQLVNECWRLVDVEAEVILASEALEELSASLLSAILSRPTLGVGSEKIVLDALYKWASAECRRQRQPQNKEGWRQVLGQMLSLPRLLTLDVKELSSLDKLYDKQEIEYVSAVVKKNPCVPAVPPLFVSFVEKMSTRRQKAGKITPNKNNKGKSKKSAKKNLPRDIMYRILCIFAHMID
ncbi:uncharacterized protein LOC108676571 isoform X2 [Hyalella azteca]|nr:uncharacterized protein LOC108676571 isoform X2 [Hyalella azteca]